MKKIISNLASILLVILFLYTAISKLFAYQRFQDQLADSPIIAPLAPFFAWGIPASEIIISALLIYRPTRLIGLASSFFLLLFFTIYIAYLIFFSPRTPCGCGGVIEQLGWVNHFYFNLFFIALSYFGVRWFHAPEQKKQISLS